MASGQEEAMRTIRFARCVIAALAVLSVSPDSAAQSAQERVMAQIAERTGLKPVTLRGAEGSYLGKTHRGYEVLYTAKAGDVWGRYVARLTMGEIARETGGVLGWLGGQYPHLGGNVAGSPLDRLLSEQIGQPLSVTVVLKHGKPHAPRLDVLSDHSKIGPGERMPQRARIGFNAGHLYADDAEFAARVAANEALMKRLSKLRSQYIRLDGDAVTLFWAGSERDYGGMINDHGDYFRMLNDILDDLADIADAVPKGA
jgi:hypothetical protein